MLDRRRDRDRFRLRDASVDGEGLQPDIPPGDWQRIRAAVYEGRGA